MERTVSVRIDHFPDRDQGPQFRVQGIKDDGFGRVIHDEVQCSDWETLTSALDAIRLIFKDSAIKRVDEQLRAEEQA